MESIYTDYLVCSLCAVLPPVKRLTISIHLDSIHVISAALKGHRLKLEQGHIRSMGQILSQFHSLLFLYVASSTHNCASSTHTLLPCFVF